LQQRESAEAGGNVIEVSRVTSAEIERAIKGWVGRVGINPC
jgi:hypothetical protein